jgi:hypothetical protein
MRDYGQLVGLWVAPHLLHKPVLTEVAAEVSIEEEELALGAELASVFVHASRTMRQSQRGESREQEECRDGGDKQLGKCQNHTARENEKHPWYIGNHAERAMGIEPTCAAWEAAILPLNYAR